MVGGGTGGWRRAMLSAGRFGRSAQRTAQPPGMVGGWGVADRVAPMGETGEAAAVGYQLQLAVPNRKSGFWETGKVVVACGLSVDATNRPPAKVDRFFVVETHPARSHSPKRQASAGKCNRQTLMTGSASDIHEA